MAIREVAEKALTADLLGRVSFATPDEFLATLTDPPDAKPKTVLGYKVKTKLASPETTGGTKRRAIAQTIAGALKRLKRT